MATYNKFQDFVEQLLKAVHDLDGTHTIKVALSNTAPNATDATFSQITEISAGAGYSAGGTAVGTVTLSETTGTAKLTLSDVVFTASGGPIGPFRYVIIYNDTPTSPADPLIAYYDISEEITLADGESFTVDFDGGAGFFTLA